MSKVTITNVEVTKIVTVWMCHEHDESVTVSSNKTKETCPECSKPMEDTGWFEE